MQTDIVQQRLSHQRIEGEKWQRPEDVVRWMGAMQAQDYAQSLWAIALRTQTATLVDVEQAIAAGKILRTWPMRGTLHFVPAEDARWMLKIVAPRIISADARRQQQLELDENIIARAADLFYRALQGGKRLARPVMMQTLEEAGISTQGQRGYHLLWYLAHTGLLCVGPQEGKQQTFALLDEWVPNPRELSREEGLAELATRYVQSHGPATAHDFAWWLGSTLTDARIGLEGAKTTLSTEKINGQSYWQAQTGPANCQDTSHLHLLPGFDEYLLGYKHRHDVLAAEHAQKIVPGNNGVFQPMIVINGAVVGTWKRSVKKQAVEVVLIPFGEHTNLQEQATTALARYSSYLGLPLTYKIENR